LKSHSLTITRCVSSSLALLLVGCLLTIPVDAANAQQASPVGPDVDAAEASGEELAIDELSTRIRRSLVKIRVTNRNGRDQGHGTGFVVGANGLIATARHVIGDRNMISIELPDGTITTATHVHAASDLLDMVIVQVAADNLSPLPLATAEPRTGESVVAVGYPRNLKKSTFAGLVSGFKEIDDINMLQLSMTIEQGSSGEPVVNRQGEVIGLVTLKSVEVANLGFAIPVSHLNKMLEVPSPIPMSHWMKIGALDSKRWETVFGANWHQRAGRILVNGSGSSFGGRSLCLQVPAPPELPFETQVEVKLNDESGAAGLVFHADGDEKHYGFYPSNGGLRLTCFNGPDVGSWTVLHNEPHPAYRANDWNTFKVRITADGMQCFVNDELVVESNDDRLPPGRVGLATFRGTSAEFRRFAADTTLPPLKPSIADAATIAEILTAVQHNRPATEKVIQSLQPFSVYSTRVLQQQALLLEQKAKQMRQLAVDVHASEIRKQLLTALAISDQPTPELADANRPQPDLLRAALLIAALDNDEVDPDAYIARIEMLADEVRQELPADATAEQRLEAMETMLFKQYGFGGSRYDYNTRSNSYLNEVIDDREGIPITLCVLYIELAKRLDLNVVGLGLPGHYVVRFESQDSEVPSQIIDVFHQGQRLSVAEAEDRSGLRPGSAVTSEFFESQQPVAIVQRMLRNLLNLAESQRDNERVLRYLNTFLAIDGSQLEFRVKRLELLARTQRLAEAIADVDWFLEKQPDGLDEDRLYELRAELNRQLDRQLAEQTP